eukprot:scaffold14920_cov63-Cylindrotheca_fusiformis.AAC.4
MKFSKILHLHFLLVSLPASANAKLGGMHHSANISQLKVASDANAAARELESVSIQYVLNNGLGRCEGDCDHDSDCAGNLVCFQRSANDAVPGCVGGKDDSSRTDYCIRPTDLNHPISDNDPHLSYIGQTPWLGLCQGDCDHDEDCGSDLVCFQRDANEEVPGCSGGGSDASRTDYCVENDWWDGRYPSLKTCLQAGDCAECAVGCSTDDDCRGGLICMVSQGAFVVPGCSGWEDREDSFSGGTCVQSKYALTESTSFPLQECEGDCDDDNDCAGYMVCFQRDSNEPVPGCVGGESDNSRTDYCVFQTQFPLSACQSDCDSDADCEGDLICLQRNGDESIDECEEYDGPETDYCVDPSWYD